MWIVVPEYSDNIAVLWTERRGNGLLHDAQNTVYGRDSLCSVWNGLLVCGVLNMGWNDFLVLTALVCILAGTGMCSVDEDAIDDAEICKFLGVILLNAAAVLVAIAWHIGAL